MFALRLLAGKKLEGQENMAIRLIYLEKTHDTIPREKAMAALRWMGKPEAEVM